MELHGAPWNSFELHGAPRLKYAFFGNIRGFRLKYLFSIVHLGGAPWSSIELHGAPRLKHVFFGNIRGFRLNIYFSTTKKMTNITSKFATFFIFFYI